MISGTAVDASGVANASMGLALLDFNLDRRFDIFVTNFEHELMALYVNRGAGFFDHGSRKVGLNSNDFQVVGFGVVAADFDSDGDEDIAFTSGHVHYYPDSGPMAQLPVLLENIDGRELVRRVPTGPFFKEPGVGRGLATADLDHDGDLDMIATRLFQPPVILENQLDGPYHWLLVTLVGVDCCRTPIGATVELNTGSRKLVRQLYGGGSYLSQSRRQLHFGWPDNTAPVNLTVRWPDGSSQHLTVQADQELVVVQDPS
jgi:hypothetical protein